MSSSQTPPPPSPWQEVVLVLLRMGIGWHFLYEGLVKALSPGWTSAAFLAESRWLLSGFFHWIVAHPVVLRIVDLLNVWGLVLIGLALLLARSPGSRRSPGSPCSRSTTSRARRSSGSRRTGRPRAAT